MAEEAVLGFEEGMSWLPAHILHEAFGAFHDEEEQVGLRTRRSQHHHHRLHHHHHHHLTGSESHSLPPLKSGRKYQNGNRGRHGGNKASSGGPGMQAVFLDRGPKTCGTGVFLPRGAGLDFQPTKKPACSTVLLPSRVVQALNLNVQALGLQISPRQDQKPNQKSGNDNLVHKEEDNENAGDQYYVISQDRSSSPELFLPKEWSY